MRLIGPSMQVFRNGNLDAAGTGDTSMHKADAIKERSQEVQFSIPVTVHQLLAAVRVAEICVESIGGLGTAISGSRPTMMVPLWWRVWLQRQTVDSRITMKDAIS